MSFNKFCLKTFCEKRLEDTSLFCGATNTFGDICPEFQSKGKSIACLFSCLEVMDSSDTSTGGVRTQDRLLENICHELELEELSETVCTYHLSC